jgi:hypothetical protein
MTLFDVRLTPAALNAAAAWAQSDMADVLLLVDDSMLVAYQGDDKTAFDTDGGVGSEEYIGLAPLDRDGSEGLAGFLTWALDWAREDEDAQVNGFDGDNINRCVREYADRTRGGQ